MVTTGITSQNITCIYSLLKIRRKYAQEQETGEKDKIAGFKFKENAFAASWLGAPDRALTRSNGAMLVV